MDVNSLYAQKLCAAEDIAAQVESGWQCFADIAAAAPPAILNALGRRAAAQQLRDVRLNGMLDLEPLAVFAPEAEGITPVSWFSGGQFRGAVNTGHGDVMPCYYRDVPDLIREVAQPDAVFLRVPPMDRHGCFSAGVTGSYTDALLRKARRVFLEVNPNMPRNLSAPILHISRVTALCEDSRPLPTAPSVDVDPASRAIGQLIAQHVPDGATIQLGIGAVPDAVGLALRDKHDLGIHTELFGDCMLELIRCGAVTNERKPIFPGRNVAVFAFGSRALYDFVDDNPAFLTLPVSFVNDPAVIARHPNFISVNSALEVDLFGQVCAESVGARHVSGTGGQADYVRGASHSQGGKSFIAFPSTAKGGAVSRIRPVLSPGAVVSTSKNDVDFVVTEFGLAKLRGMSLAQRARALIAIAHPSFRDELTFQAKQRNILL